eukprot:1115479-Rhodomonas_salina.2
MLLGVGNAVCGTDLGYAARPSPVAHHQLPAGLKQPGPISLRACYALSGTDLACGAGIYLRACYALSGTDLAHAAAMLAAFHMDFAAGAQPVEDFAAHVRSATPTCLRACYAMPGTDLALRTCYAMRGTELAYGASISAYAMRGTERAYGATRKKRVVFSERYATTSKV